MTKGQIAISTVACLSFGAATFFVGQWLIETKRVQKNGTCLAEVQESLNQPNFGHGIFKAQECAFVDLTKPLWVCKVLTPRGSTVLVINRDSCKILPPTPPDNTEP